MNIEKQPYSELIDTIGSLLQQGRQQAAQSVNTILVQTYWFIGQHIVEFEQEGNEKAEYGKGLSRSNIFQILQIYEVFFKIRMLCEVSRLRSYSNEQQTKVLE
jgi:hypothetical protein